MRLMWHQYSQEEYWGILLIDMYNEFNEVNQNAMLWEVRHEWPSGTQFTFNCYRQWANLVIQDGGGGWGNSFITRKVSPKEIRLR